MSNLEYQNEQAYFLSFCIEQYKHLKNMDGADVKKLFDFSSRMKVLFQDYAGVRVSFSFSS